LRVGDASEGHGSRYCRVIDPNVNLNLFSRVKANIAAKFDPEGAKKTSDKGPGASNVRTTKEWVLPFPGLDPKDPEPVTQGQSIEYVHVMPAELPLTHLRALASEFSGNNPITQFGVKRA